MKTGRPRSPRCPERYGGDPVANAGGVQIHAQWCSDVRLPHPALIRRVQQRRDWGEVGSHQGDGGPTHRGRPPW
jgi:hypothetical protein